MEFKEGDILYNQHLEWVFKIISKNHIADRAYNVETLFYNSNFCWWYQFCYIQIDSCVLATEEQITNVMKKYLTS